MVAEDQGSSSSGIETPLKNAECLSCRLTQELGYSHRLTDHHHVARPHSNNPIRIDLSKLGHTVLDFVCKGLVINASEI